MIEKWKPYILVVGILTLTLTALFLNRITKAEEDITDSAIYHHVINGSDTSESAVIYVDIKGAVHKPGVYKIDEGTRLFQLVRQAGGLTAEADATHLNLAMKLEDQMMITIRDINHTEAYEAAVDHQDESLDEAVSMPDDTRISISHADHETLITLPNIGPATAQAIIDYRATHGPFEKTEDIMLVSGIGQATYDAIEALIKP